MRTPLHFLWKRLKALLQKRVVRVRHNAVTPCFHWSPEDWDEGEEDLWAMVFLDDLFD